MSSWTPLLRVDAGHGYFRDGRCAPLAFEPSEASAALACRAGLIVRPQPGALTVLCSTEAFVSEADLRPTASEALAPLLTKRDATVRPVAVLRLRLADAVTALAEGATSAPRAYRLDFRPRETHWRYLLLGGLAERAASVVDPEGSTEFERTGETTLPGDRAAVAFVSRTRIPLQERSDRRFQLRENGNNGSNGGRVLIRRLPVASPREIHREIVDGRDALVSDIYLNG